MAVLVTMNLESFGLLFAACSGSSSLSPSLWLQIRYYQAAMARTRIKTSVCLEG